LPDADEEQLDLAGGDGFEVFRDQVDMPVFEIDRGRFDHMPSSVDVKPEIVAKDNPIAVEVRVG
jgi:hypothetical protein